MKKLHVNSMKLVISLIVFFTGTGLFYSCKRAAEKTQERLIEKSIGDKADVDIADDKVVIKTDEGTFTTDATKHEWPSEIPADVPEFTKGKVVIVNTQEMIDGKNWVVIFEDVSQEAIENYKKELEENNFEINFTTTAGTGTHFAAQKGKLVVMLMGDEKGASISINVQN
ncbi:MAG: hypothetical protein WBM98_03225 [Maribacter sp.]|uniref:hypothetical protein n=1 Tax=Maribacter sp. TaxID=1897614 RepID=UPI003C78881F